MGKKLYSDEELLNRLQKFAEKLGRPPTTEEMDQDGPYTAGPYKQTFGNWNQALRRAGLDVYYARNVSEEDLTSELNRLADELGHVPRQDEMRDRGRWSVTIYQERFGSWSEALTAAGFEPNHRWRIPQEELLAELRDLADDLGGGVQIRIEERGVTFSECLCPKTHASTVVSTRSS